MYQHAAKIAINTDDCVDDDDYVDDTTNVRLSDRVSNPIFLEEARRYMRYATAGTYLYVQMIFGIRFILFHLIWSDLDYNQPNFSFSCLLFQYSY